MADEVQIIVEESIEQVLINVNEAEDTVDDIAIEVFETMGVNGVDGLSAYQIAVNAGFVGTEEQWIASLKGADGTPGGSYTHNQGVPESVWEIEHNLGFYPNATVVDSGGTKVIGDVEYIDTNNIKLTFSGAFSGKAYLS